MIKNKCTYMLQSDSTVTQPSLKEEKYIYRSKQTFVYKTAVWALGSLSLLVSLFLSHLLIIFSHFDIVLNSRIKRS